MRHERQSWDIAGSRGGAGDNLPFSALYLDEEKVKVKIHGVTCE